MSAFEMFEQKECGTWKCEVAAGGLVGDPVVDNVDVLRECLGQGALRLAHVLLLALGAGHQVHQVAGRAVHPAVDPHRLT